MPTDWTFAEDAFKRVENKRQFVANTKAAIDVLRNALKRCGEEYKHGIPLKASAPLWGAAFHLTQSLPLEER